MRVWYLDRKISLTLVVMLFVQIVAVITWATYLEARVKGLEVNTQPMTTLLERFARLEERIDFVRADIAQIKGDIERISRKTP